MLAAWKKSYDQPWQHIEKQRHYFANKGPYSQSYGFSSSHVWMWELDYKESWALKNWCFWTMVLEKTLENPLDCKEIQPIHPKGDQSWIFIGRTDAEAETRILWPPDWRTDSIEKTLMLGKIEGRRRRGQQRMRWLDGIIDSTMWPNHLIVWHLLLLLPSTFPSIRVFSNELAFHIRWPKYWSMGFSISPSNEYSGLTSFRTDWFDLLAVQGTLKSLLQHHNSKASILWHSAFFMVRLSHPYMTIGKTIDLTIKLPW